MHTCPVCAYSRLQEAPHAASGGGSYEICPSCGFQFGVDDDDKGISYEEWREKWKARGAPWSSRGISAPKGWNGLKQMQAAAGDGKKSIKSKPAKKLSRKKTKS